MKKLFFLVLANILFLYNFDAKADHIVKGVFICKSKDLLDEITSIAIRIDNAKKSGDEDKIEEGKRAARSLIINGQCSLTDKVYKAQLLDFGFTKHKIRIYDDKGGNFVVWALKEDYVIDN